jgi:signal transduction histidine kinase
VQVQRLLRDAVATAEIGQDEVPVQLDISEPLPAVRGDAERLRQVISNLVDNAIKYSPHGEPVEVRAWGEDGTLLVTVSDSGPGIPVEQQKLIFEKFGRAESGAKPGTGLGLFIARSIAEAHGGTLGVESQPGSGTTFRLELPLHH